MSVLKEKQEKLAAVEAKVLIKTNFYSSVLSTFVHAIFIIKIMYKIMFYKKF